MAKNRFGKAFPDELNKVTGKFRGHLNKNTKESSDWQDYLFSGGEGEQLSTHLTDSWRKLFFVISVLILFSVILIRLVHLQVVEGERSRDLADSNRVQVKIIHAPRGVIYDRNGKILAQNEPGFRLVEGDKNPPNVTVISRDEALQMEVNSNPRFKYLEIDTIRSYPQGEITSHIIGYVSEITADELRDSQYLGYKLGDRIGRGGVEEVYEKILKGIDGGEVIEVDSKGKKIRTLNKKEAVPGQNLYLTIDSDLQKVVFEKLSEGIKKVGSCCGAAVAIDPHSGQIYSLVSIPAFDPSSLTQSLEAPDSPFLNRVIAGSYPPGSTFKIASALAGLNSGKITSSTQFEDTGVMTLGTSTFSNWYFSQYGRKEGMVDIVKALKRSNDIYFYNLGRLVGEKTLADVAKNLGLGKRLGIDIPGEAEGVIPDNDWKVKNLGEIWFPGDTLHMSIGQGFVLTTPLQISYLTSTVAAEGKQFPPHLALKITDPFSKNLKDFKYDSLTSKEFKKDNLAIIKQGLSQVTKEGGTAWPFFTFPIKTAGKTGTAEFGDPKGRTHAWYTSFAPEDNPRITLTVLVEAGGEGSTIAGSISKEIYRWYFSDNKANLIKDIYIVATESARTLGE
ncbi:penicillin-binding protein 2 [Candidatus Daviesbacteria bacterium]|nr:penicillin-binding protein 2 [Candidatus Daviesbacteria bacterium]